MAYVRLLSIDEYIGTRYSLKALSTITIPNETGIT